MVQAKEHHLNLLKKPAGMIPQYQRMLSFRLAEDGERLRDLLGAFLKATVTPEGIDIARAASPDPDPRGYTFDALDHDGTPAVRVAISRQAMIEIASAVFSGPIDEPMILQGVGSTLALRCAAVLMGLPEDGSLGPEIIGGPDGPLSDQPVLRVAYAFKIGDTSETTLTIEAAREWTDELASPPPCLTEERLDQMPFAARAELHTFITSLRAAAKWEKGSIVQMPNADLSSVTITAATATGSIELGTGEMGTDDDLRCVRLGAKRATSAAASAFGIDDAEEASDIEDALARFGIDEEQVTEFAAAPMPDFGT